MAQKDVTIQSLRASTPIFYYHVPKNILLIILSIITIPITTTIVTISLVLSKLKPKPVPPAPHYVDTRKTILITGVSMTKGLTISRLLAQNTPHRIIGADVEPIPFTSPGRYSCSLSAFYTLEQPDDDDAEPYIDSLLSVMQREKVDLWISCSSVIAAVEDGNVASIAKGEMGPNFHAIQFSAEDVEKLHNKDTFIDYIATLGLDVPLSYRCTSSDEVLDILSSAHRGREKTEKEKQFIMKPIGVDDRARGTMMTLLPLSTPSATNAHIATLQVTQNNPFQLQQYISGEEYCTHALVIRGVVKAFTACPSSDLLMHYKALPPSSLLHQQMLDFTTKVALDGGEEFTGHLSFDFLVEGEGKDMKIYPIECNPRAHTAVILFSETPELADAYMDVYRGGRKRGECVIFPKTRCHSYYWVGHDLVTLLIIPLLEMMCGSETWKGVKEDWLKFWMHLLYWSDGTFVVWDAVPFWVLYHVYWPAQFVRCLVKGKKWSR